MKSDFWKYYWVLRAASLITFRFLKIVYFTFILPSFIIYFIHYCKNFEDFRAALPPEENESDKVWGLLIIIGIETDGERYFTEWYYQILLYYQLQVFEPCVCLYMDYILLRRSENYAHYEDTNVIIFFTWYFNRKWQKYRIYIIGMGFNILQKYYFDFKNSFELILKNPIIITIKNYLYYILKLIINFIYYYLYSLKRFRYYIPIYCIAIYYIDSQGVLDLPALNYNLIRVLDFLFNTDYVMYIIYFQDIFSIYPLIFKSIQIIPISVLMYVYFLTTTIVLELIWVSHKKFESTCNAMLNLNEVLYDYLSYQHKMYIDGFKKPFNKVFINEIQKKYDKSDNLLLFIWFFEVNFKVIRIRSVFFILVKRSIKTFIAWIIYIL